MPYHYSSRKELISRASEFTGYFLLKAFSIPDKKHDQLNTHPQILIAEPFQMGDVVSTSVLLDPLVTKYPESEIYILTKPANVGVVSADPRIKKVLTADFPWSDYGSKKGSFARWWALLKTLWSFRKYKFDIGIDCRGDVRTQLLLMLLNCRKRIGYTNYLNSNITLRGLLLTDKMVKAPYIHRYDWNIYLLTLLGFSEKELFPIRFPTLQLPYLTTDHKTDHGIVIHIGGGWKYKRWLEARWVELIRSLSARYDEHITVVGGPGEKVLVEEIKSLLPSEIRVTFKITTFEELIRLIDQCRLFIGLDSGPMNIANALGKKAVALFGPGDSSVWYPYHQDSLFLHKKEQFPCNPCAQKQCFYPQKNCMASIEVEEVLQAVNQVANRKEVNTLRVDKL
jgi:ADP-heptose:LPS heptosyltransferase